MIPIETVIEELIDREGGFVNHSADRGGATKYGITQKTLSAYRGRDVSVQEVSDLTRAEAANIYRNNFLTSIQLHRINDPYVMTLAFDCSVHHGPARAVQWMQKIVGVREDGVFGDVTELAVNTYDPVKLHNRLLAKRIRFFGEIVSDDPELRRARRGGFNLQAEFAAGWNNRAAKFLEVP